MKSYPSISRHTSDDGVWYIFDKKDGSQIRAEWSRKKGFHKFGRRHGLLDDSNPFLPESKDLILNKYSETLTKRFKDARYDEVTCFFEFYGENSFAGNHEHEPHTVTLFDVDVYKHGLLDPKSFVSLTDGIEVCTLLHQGYLSDIQDAVYQSTLKGMTYEGVVAKRKEGREILMTKLKSKAWLERLRAKIVLTAKNPKEVDELFEQLR